MRLADVRTDSRGYRGAGENPDDILPRRLPITLGPNTHQRGIGHREAQGETPDQRGLHQARHLNYGGVGTLGVGGKTVGRPHGPIGEWHAALGGTEGRTEKERAAPDDL